MLKLCGHCASKVNLRPKHAPNTPGRSQEIKPFSEIATTRSRGKCAKCGTEGELRVLANTEAWHVPTSLLFTMPVTAKSVMALSKREGALRIADERIRQVVGEKLDADHDDAHVNGELAVAACCYAAAAASVPRVYGDSTDADDGVDLFPWPEWDKRPPLEGTALEDGIEIMSINTKIRMLEKAGALCAAEIDRLLRMVERGAVEPEPLNDDDATDA